MKLHHIIIASAVLVLGCTPGQSAQTEKVATIQVEMAEGEAVATFASGCFWCVEEVFESLKGVREAVSGYAGGDTENPTYKLIGTGRTGHAESVQVYYDPEVISFEVLVEAFFASHDPTTLNRQGPDAGSQYRSAAFYANDEEKAIIDAAIKKLEDVQTYNGAKITTEVTMLEKFWPAEDYHQNFVKNNPNQGYVRAVSIPRFERFKENFDAMYFK